MELKNLSKKSLLQQKNKPKVLLVIEDSTNSVGGMEISFIRHVKLLNDYIEVIPVTVCLETDDNNYMGKMSSFIKDEIRGYNIIISDVFQNEKNDLLYSCVTNFLIDIAKIEDIEAIQVYGAYQLLPFSCGLASNKLEIPYIISFIGSDFNVRIYHSQFNHLIKSIELANACTFVNSESLTQFSSLFPLTNSKLIYNYIDKSEFEIDIKESKCDIRENRIILGCSGNFRRIMGIGLLLDVFEEVTSLNSNVSLNLIGSFRESEANYFNDRINKLKNAKKIKITGFIDHAHVLNFVNNCDIMLYPSLSDGCPNKVLESMYMKKAIIASDTRGISNLIENEKEGILIHPYNKTKWVNKILELINNSEKRNELGQNAYSKVNTKFTKEITLDRWLTLYKSLGICI